MLYLLNSTQNRRGGEKEMAFNKRIFVVIVTLISLSIIFSGCLESRWFPSKIGPDDWDKIPNNPFTENNSNHHVIETQKNGEIRMKQEADPWPIFIGESFDKLEEAIGATSKKKRNWDYYGLLGAYKISASIRDNKFIDFHMRIDGAELVEYAKNDKDRAIEIMARPNQILPENILASEPYHIYGSSHYNYSTQFKQTLLVVWKLDGEVYINLFLVTSGDYIWRKDVQTNDEGKTIIQRKLRVDFPKSYQDWNQFGVVRLTQENILSIGPGYYKCE